MAKHRRTFPPELKARALEPVTEQVRCVAEVARDLDLSEGPPRSRDPALAVDGPRAPPGRGDSPAPEDGPRRRRAEDERLAMGRDVPEGAAASVAGGSSGGTTSSGVTAGDGRSG